MLDARALRLFPCSAGKTAIGHFCPQASHIKAPRPPRRCSLLARTGAARGGDSSFFFRKIFFDNWKRRVCAAFFFLFSAGIRKTACTFFIAVGMEVGVCVWFD